MSSANADQDGWSDSIRKVEALTAPRNVVLVGASDRPGSWPERVWQNVSRYDFKGNIYLVNPRREELWGRRCYPDIKSLPEPPDHLAVLVPAPAVVPVLLEGAEAGARSATVFGTGFGESGDPKGIQLGRQLDEAIRTTGIALSGPNCMGNVCGKSRLVTLTHQRPLNVQAGPVAIVGQSGGVMIRINNVLEERGIGSGYLITSGNEAGLTTADYIAFFATQPEIKVIVCYLEAISGAERFKGACKLARDAGKAIVAFKLGATEAGRKAAMAHTGSLAGSAQVFDAVMAEYGVLRADTLDDAIEAIEFLYHSHVPDGRRLAAVTLSGAFRGLLLEAAENNGLFFPELGAETQQRIGKLLEIKGHVGNPVDAGIGITSSAETYVECVRALEEDPSVDCVLVHDDLPRGPESTRKEMCLRATNAYVARESQKPIAYITLLTQSHNDFSRKLHGELPNLAFLEEANKGLRVIDRAVQCREAQGAAEALAPSGQMPAAIRTLIGGIEGVGQPMALDEARSKAILSSYGIAVPEERLAASAAAAVRAAEEIGFPVVMKIVSDKLLHKSDIGGVALDLRTSTEVAGAYDDLVGKLKRHDPTAASTILVAKQVSGGTELVLGLHRDPEMGLVAMVGAGGVLLELVNDVAFAAPPITPAKARRMIEQTRVSKLLGGYRGGAVGDIAALADALVALGRLAADMGERIESVDINPLLVRPNGLGAVALDALVILR